MPIRLAVAAALLFASTALGADTVVRLTLKGRTVEGLIAGHDDHAVHLIGADGALSSVPIGAVRDFRKTGSRLRADNAVKVKARLIKEFGRDYEVVTSARYVVVAPHGRAKGYLATLDGVARGFVSHFAKRRIPLTDPAFPLVAIVFASEDEFAAYAREDGLPSVASVAGYYLRTSNRVAAYEPPSLTARSGRPFRGGPFGDFRPAGPDASGAGELRETLVHEATHQLAFNTGLHSRVGNDPKWVIEGLATLMEPDAVRGRSLGTAGERVNAGRLRYAQRQGLGEWSTATVASLVSSDGLFQTDAAGAYSLAWSLSFYLNEQRPADYARYLARLKARDPLKPYSADQRLTDFRLAFGNDLARFDAAFRRFMAGLPEA